MGVVIGPDLDHRIGRDDVLTETRLVELRAANDHRRRDRDAEAGAFVTAFLVDLAIAFTSPFGIMVE